ncbi:MAG: ATP-binding protein [bacterium]|nr:ATP-binding protein [bacterium]
MKLQTKILLTLTPLLAVIILVLGLLSFSAARQGVYQSTQQYMGLVLKQRVQELTETQQLLERTGLVQVPAYISQYQSEMLTHFRQRSQEEPSLYVLVLDFQGRVLFANHGAQTATLQGAYSQLIDRFTKSNQFVNGEVSSNQLHQVYTAQRFLPWRWVVVVATPASEVLALINEIRNLTWIASGSSFLVLMLVVSVFTRKFLVKPIDQLKTSANRIAQGLDPAEHLPESADELGELAQSIQQMAYSIQTAQAISSDLTDGLQRSKEFLEAVMQNSPDAIFICNRTRHILNSNMAAVELTGRKATQLEGLTLEQLCLTPEASEALKEALDQVCFSATALHGYEVELADRQNHPVPTMLGASVVDDGPRLRMVVSLQNISTRVAAEAALLRAKEEAEAAAKIKTEFLANMSHEIRTPLNTILGYAELLDQEVFDPRHKSHLSSIRLGGNNLLTLINDILDLSKIEAGRLEPKRQALSIEKLLFETRQIFALSTESKGLYCEVELDTPLPPWLMLDGARIRQILVNLVGNAVKFTKTGGIILKAQFTGKLDGRGRLEIAVIDTGIGIAENQQQRIFESFRQGSTDITVEYGGTGLGLAISSKLAQLLGGDLVLDSQPGQGSRFTLVLEQVELAEPPTQEESAPQAFDLANYRFQPATLLVVDDSEMNRTLLRGFLEKVGLQTLDAANGLEALEVAKRNRPQMILMDLKMPLMDGYEATAELKRDRSTAPIPVLAVTASVLQPDLDQIDQLGFEGYLLKPVGMQALFDVLARYLPLHTGI